MCSPGCVSRVILFLVKYKIYVSSLLSASYMYMCYIKDPGNLKKGILMNNDTFNCDNKILETAKCLKCGRHFTSSGTPYLHLYDD